MPRPPLPPFARIALTAVVAGIGTLAFHATGLPLPFLFGPMCACLLSALIGLPLQGFGQVSVAGRTILGVAVGASITPAVLARLPEMAVSIALVPIFIAVIGAVGVPFFRRVWGFDGATAYYAAMPGGLQDMVIFGIEAGGDARALSLIHATRVLFIVTLAPVLLTQLYGSSLSNPIGAPVAALPLVELALMAAAAWIGWKGGERIGLFGASILGPMIVTAALALSGLVHSRPPAEAILVAQFLIGCGIGVHFVGVTMRELGRDVAAGAAYVVVLAALAAMVSSLVTWLDLAEGVDAFLAFAPGGQAEMTVLAIVAGADLGYVIAHHLTRIVLVITGAPVIAGIKRRAGPRG
ncbi:AbrB family transcriptional regulator [Profundibacterium mesophilum]|uniref:Ammonia monooxygenase n=1 Tax=Profundibacterium mesophilum KAUST100406-0324 TaxID=1037889 RepID=A0A921NS24_9RHOB|nr:AbrB family transcriptional regulator [Profundibacterium mesophilum]KAF0676850.1 putative ammonia monooxygenase [Profundibacterium mesophilum KAUST100406-0324]